MADERVTECVSLDSYCGSCRALNNGQIKFPRCERCSASFCPRCALMTSEAGHTKIVLSHKPPGAWLRHMRNDRFEGCIYVQAPYGHGPIAAVDNPLDEIFDHIIGHHGPGEHEAIRQEMMPRRS